MKGPPPEEKPVRGRRARLHEVVFESDTRAGRAFDLTVLLLIVSSVMAVVIESMSSVRAGWERELRIVEWGFTIAFTVEYLLRLIAVRNPWRYARSFFGVVDLLAIAPTYFSLVIPGAQTLLIVRVLRLLRVFRILKLAHFLSEAEVLTRALRASRRKITVFLFTVVTIVVIVGALMYLIEGADSGFDNIPRAMYWAVVTVTTVGFGDITPQTPLGQLLASALVILGYGIIAVPTGIVSVELAEATRASAVVSTQACPACGFAAHDPDATFCKRCGSAL